MKDHGVDDPTCDDVPRGVVVGTVELVRCEGGDCYRSGLTSLRCGVA
jgi:hypothetical protein